MLDIKSSVAASNEAPTLKLNGGLEAQLISIGRNKEHNTVTIAAMIKNNGINTAYLMLAGAPPMATDNTGTKYSSRSFGGVTACPSLDNGYTELCIGVTKTQENITPPLQSFTQIDPKTELMVNFELVGNSGNGPLMTFAATFMSRFVSDPVKDSTLSEKEKRQQIHLMNLSFTPAPV